jgi:hypothetical protein
MLVAELGVGKKPSGEVIPKSELAIFYGNSLL